LTLELDPEYSPPATIPTDPRATVYSSPANDHMLEPVKVRVLDGGNLVTDSVTVIATTIDEANFNVPNTGDTYSGIICTHRAYFSRFNWCRYLVDGECESELICNTTDSMYPLGKVEVESVNGVAEFPRLLHTEPSVGSNRRLRFTASHGGNTATVDSNPFAVHCKQTCAHAW